MEQQETSTALHDKEAERAVLGALLMDNEVMPRIEPVIGDVPGAFFTTDHQLIFDACREVYAEHQTSDIVMVAALLKKQDNLKRVGGTIYLYDLQERIVETENTEHHAEILRDKALRRQLAQAGNYFTSLSVEDNDLTDIIDEAQQTVMNLGKSASTRGLQPINPWIHDAIDEMNRLTVEGAKTPGLATGFQDFDILTTGLHPGELCIIAARPNRGKSAFSLNVALNVALQEGVENTVAFFSLEMSTRAMIQRMLSSESLIPFSNIRNGNLKETEWQPFTKTCSDLLEIGNRIRICTDFGATAPVIRQEARRLKHSVDNLSLIVVDYLQKVKVKGATVQNREQAVSQVSAELKELAGELEVPIIACAQINRSVENEKREPQLSDLRESGAIEQDADIVGFLHSDNELPNQELSDIKLIVRKQRNGPTGTVNLQFAGPIMRFRDETMGGQ